MTLQALRNKIGDKKFFAILKGWPAEKAHGNARIKDFVSYAEKVSGKPLAGLFDTWLYQPVRPEKAALGAEARHDGAKGGKSAPKSWREIQAVNGSHRH